MIPSRRNFSQLAFGGLLGLAGCASSAVAHTATDGRLSARPGAVTTPGSRTGLFLLDGWPRPLVYIPPGIDASRPTPFILLLHGGGSSAEWTMDRMLPVARERGVILLAPQSQGRTWDVIRAFRLQRGEDDPPHFGSDTARVDASLRSLFATYNVDPAKAAIAGFSDGASYALSLGARNGDLFRHIMAFSAGGVVPFSDPPARPKIFMSHGRQDPVLGYANAAEGIAPGFRGAGFDVEFVSFDGMHEFREPEMRKAFDWYLGKG